MIPQVKIASKPEGLDKEVIRQAVADSLADCRDRLRKVLLIPPDFTRLHSNAGRIANLYYHFLQDSCQVDLLPALGTHVPMTQEECALMYGDIPFERFLVHNWREDLVKLGQVPAAFVREVSEGILDEPIDVEVNHRLLDGGYDAILSIGQVVPHEVVGMANYSKNVFVGCGGSRMINASHALGAYYGLERLMGRDHSPVRRVFDYAQDHFLKDLPLDYALTVTTAPGGEIRTHGLFIGGGRAGFEQAVRLSQEKNLIHLDRPIVKAVVYLDPQEFKTTWLGNKAVYRTRMAVADGGELFILAPGVKKFGEDPEIDGLIRKYGYTGRERIMGLARDQSDLQENLSAAAHLIHGSADGRFRITYCTRHLTRQEVEGVGFAYQPYGEAAARYDPAALHDGWNRLSDGEEIYFIRNPALGLWVAPR